MPSIRDQITIIGSELQKASAQDRIVIEDKTEFHVRYSYEFYQRIPDMFGWTFPAQYQEENKNTIEYFYKVFGEKKVQSVSKAFNLQIDYKRRWELPLVKNDIEKLFVGCALIHYHELENFFDDLKKGKNRHLDSDQAEDFRKRFTHRHLLELTNEELQEFYHAMNPFDRIETIFLENIPRFDFDNSADPRSFEDVKRFVYTYEVMRRRSLVDLAKDQSESVKKLYRHFHQLRLMKKLVNFNQPDQLIYDTPKGLMYHHCKVEAGGAFVIALKAIKPDPKKKFFSRLYFLPTQCLNSVPQPWESLADDLRFEIGSAGAKAIYPEIEDLLKATRGFISDTEKIDIHGYSLGGNQAMRVAVALYPTGKIRKVVSVSNPGIDEGTASYFNELVKKHAFPIKISIFSELDDHTVRYGQCQLGYLSDARSVKIRCRWLDSSESKEREIERKEYFLRKDFDAFPKREKCTIGAAAMASLLLKSLAEGHGRESYLVKGMMEHSICNYQKQAEDPDLKRKFMDRYVLSNAGYSWEESRSSILNQVTDLVSSWVRPIRRERYLDFLKEVHALSLES